MALRELPLSPLDLMVSADALRQSGRELGFHSTSLAGVSVEDWSKARWFVVFPGIADAWLWGFDVNGKWRLRHGNPARASLAILPGSEEGPLATLEDAVWIADCIAFDHDAPIGVRPGGSNTRIPFPYEPIHPFPDRDSTLWYFDNLHSSYSAAAEARFGDSYCLRYGEEDRSAPSTDFATRFADHEQQLVLYSMATRQADVLAEFLCLYRVLEAADQSNGVTFATQELGSILEHDFGELAVMETRDAWTNAFDVYKRRASVTLEELRSRSMTDEDISRYLYSIRNSLAHGKEGPRVSDFGARVEEAVSALPILKLIARIAVEE